MLSGNEAKYMTKNPLKKHYVRKFRGVVRFLFDSIIPQPTTILDAECGEGYMIDLLLQKFHGQIYGIDISSNTIETANLLFGCDSRVKLQVGDVRELPFADNSFDLVICNEVLEHVDETDLVMNELCRVSKSRAMLSVPHEPYFWLGNLITLNHLGRLGNAPGHIRHFTSRTFANLLGTYFDEYELKFSFPWLISFGVFRGKKCNAKNGLYPLL